MKVAMYARFGNEPQPKTNTCHFNEERFCGNGRKNIFEVVEMIARLERKFNLNHSKEKH